MPVHCLHQQVHTGHDRTLDRRLLKAGSASSSAAKPVLSSELPALCTTALPEARPFRACAGAAASCLLAAAAGGAPLAALEPGLDAAPDARLLPLAGAWSLSGAVSTAAAGALARRDAVCLLAGADAGRSAAAGAFCCPDLRWALVDRAGAEGGALRLLAAARVVRPAAEGLAGLASSGASEAPPVSMCAGP